jgi:hypothetical protein
MLTLQISLPCALPGHSAIIRRAVGQHCVEPQKDLGPVSGKASPGLLAHSAAEALAKAASTAMTDVKHSPQ